MKTSTFLVVIVFIVFFSCKKESFITSTDASVTITADTLKYDTVFVTAGSVYQSFKIINENDRKLRLSSIRLLGGSQSSFSINADGFPGPEVSAIDIEPNDSIYVFVQVKVDPATGDLPFVIRDSIQVSYNGQNRLVQLEAWGKNAHFLRNVHISADETWPNDLPYVILGSLTVDPGVILSIDKGSRIYVHADAPLLIDGTLKVNGEKDTVDRVYFRGDRLDDPYRDFPASWPGIFFRTSSSDNVLNYAVIKNAYQAVALQDLPGNANPKLTLNECVIDNAYDAGIISVNSSITAVNCLVSNCGKNVVLLKGGDYSFTHCTAASFANTFLPHSDQVLLVSNFINIDNSPVTAPLNASFTNCIFWGDGGIVDDEVVVAISGTNSPVIFTNSLFKALNNPTNTTLNQTIINQDPLFDSVNTSRNYYDFRLKADSPAIDKGVDAGVNLDLDGHPRPIGLPDIGCFEKQ